MPHLHGEKKILQDFKVLVNSNGPAFNYDAGTIHDINEKVTDSNNFGPDYIDPE